MGLIPTLNTFVPGTPIRASTVNENFDRIVTVVNGQLNDLNILQISAEKVTSGEFDPDRIPRLSEDKLPQAAQGFLKAKGATTDPAYELVQWGDVQGKPAQATRWPAWSEVTGKPATFPPEGHTHDAGDIDSGRLDLARLPTSATANRFLKVDTANSTPAYSTILWADVQSKPSAFPPVAHSHPISNITGLQSALDGKAPTSHSHTVGQLPVGSTNNTQVAPGQAMTGSGDARHPVGSIRFVGIQESPVTAGSSYTTPRSVEFSTAMVSGYAGNVLSPEITSTTLPGTWQALNDGVLLPGTNTCFVLAVRTS